MADAHAVLLAISLIPFTQSISLSLALSSCCVSRQVLRTKADAAAWRRCDREAAHVPRLVVASKARGGEASQGVLGAVYAKAATLNLLQIDIIIWI